MLMCELNRISSHLLLLATNGMDLGAVVDDALRLARARAGRCGSFEKVTGLRMNHNYIRPGGWPPTSPTAGATTCCAICDTLPERMDEYDDLLTGQPIWRERMQGVGVITAEECLALGLTGPLLRSTGSPRTSAATCRTSPTTRSTST